MKDKQYYLASFNQRDKDWDVRFLIDDDTDVYIRWNLMKWDNKGKDDEDLAQKVANEIITLNRTYTSKKANGWILKTKEEWRKFRKEYYNERHCDLQECWYIVDTDNGELTPLQDV